MAQNSARAAVEERQLKPIYEALDTGNVKSALTQCNKLLKKYPAPSSSAGSGTPVQSTPANMTRQLLTALKILALVRANKLDEASTLTTALLAETPTDETVLSTLAHSLKPLDRPKELVGMWVNAWGRATKDAEEFKKKNKAKMGTKPVDTEYASLQQHAEELGAQAFMSMVRTGHWVMAQSTAFKLYRAFAPPKGTEGAQSHPSLRYLYWSVMSAIMQSQYPYPPAPVPVLVMIPPPPQVKEWEETKKKEEEEDKKLIAEQGGENGAIAQGDSKLSPSRRKKRALALTLAQRLIEMSVEIKDNEADVRGMSVERFWLWGEVLRRIAEAGDQDHGASSERWNEAHKFLSTPLATRAAGTSLHVEELRADIARLACDWKREAEGMATRLGRGDRNWKTVAYFLDALFHFLPNAPESPDPEEYPSIIVQQKKPSDATAPVAEGADAQASGQENGEADPEKKAPVEEKDAAESIKNPLTLAYTRDFLKRLADGDEAAHPGRERASHLGVIELEKRVRKSGLAPEQAPLVPYLDLIITYFDLFATKAVVVEDLLPYVSDLDEEEQAKLDEYLASVELKTDDLASLQQTINVVKLQRLMSQSSACTIESELAYAQKCMRNYHTGLLLGKDLVSTELQPADDLAVLAVTALINAHHLATQDPAISPSDKHSYLYDSVVLLEFASAKSRWAYASRFLLTRLHRLLGASSLALQHYTMANVKSVQCDTLSHHVLSRASTFSLGCVGDLSLINECVESSQVYSVNGVDTSDQLVKAFQYERYTQIADFVMLEEKVDNSLQRDITKLEHFRMKNMHEGLTPETVEVELVELRFVWGRVHHDNRDFDLLPNYQPKGAQTIDTLTSLAGGPISQQWFLVMLKLWILVLHQASEQLWTEEEQQTVVPKISTFEETELEQLTPAERLLVKYSRRLIDWLAPHHAPIKHTVMTNAVSTLAAAKAKQAASTSSPASTTNGAAASTKAKSNVGRKANGLSNGTEGTAASNAGDGGLGVKVGDTKVITGMLTLHDVMDVPPVPKDLAEAVKEPPSELNDLLEELQKLFDETLSNPASLPWENLHVAQLVQEAVFITHLLTARFALGSSKKKSYPTFKPLRAKAIDLLTHAAKAISALGEEEFNSEKRKQWLDDRRKTAALEELTDEHIISTGRKYMESRKKMLEQLGKGMTKAQTSIAKAAAGVPAGSTA